MSEKSLSVSPTPQPEERPPKCDTTDVDHISSSPHNGPLAEPVYDSTLPPQSTPPYTEPMTTSNPSGSSDPQVGETQLDLTHVLEAVCAYRELNTAIENDLLFEPDTMTTFVNMFMPQRYAKPPSVASFKSLTHPCFNLARVFFPK